LIALVLMMATTLITLSVTRTHVTETRIAANESWYARLQLSAQSAWEKATAELAGHPPALAWVASNDSDTLVAHVAPVTDHQGIQTAVTFEKGDKGSRLVKILAVSGGKQGIGLSGRVSQTVRLLTVLTPRAETAPPLIINGCPSAGPGSIDIRPVNSDHDNVGDAIWHVNSARCPSLDSIDIHGGQRLNTALNNTLWSTLFSLSPDEFERLATSELTLPAARRRYWLARPADLTAGRWSLSLGTPDAPVVLVFPGEFGCPHFAGGVHIVGFVFIDAACPDPLTDAKLEITGTLAINGDVYSGSGTIRLNHIQTADKAQVQLSLPVIKIVKVPGTWKDF
jgi:hypothetical protein